MNRVVEYDQTLIPEIEPQMQHTNWRGRRVGMERGALEPVFRLLCPFLLYLVPKPPNRGGE